MKERGRSKPMTRCSTFFCFIGFCAFFCLFVSYVLLLCIIFFFNSQEKTKKKKNFLFFCARVCFSFLRIFTVTTAGTPTVTVRRPKMLSIIFVCVCNHQVVHLATLKKKGNGWVMKKKQKKKNTTAIKRIYWRAAWPARCT